MGALAETLAIAAFDTLLVGRHDLARLYVERAVEIAGPNDTPWAVPGLLFQLGEILEAKRTLAIVNRVFASDRSYLAGEKRFNDAAALMAAGNIAAALELVPDAPKEERAHPHRALFRGRLLLAAGRASEAAEAFRHAYEWRLFREPTPLPAVSKIWLARALAKAGDTPGARTAYQDAFGVWKDADADLPLLVEAKQEYAALR